MAHQHPVKDTDLHFVIDPVTRVVKNNSGKIVIMQHDHQSEILTFELPRYIDTHDMSLCDTVRIHYINIGTSSKYTPVSGVYEVNDLKIDAVNDSIVTCSWTLTNNTTRLEGTLNFIVRFSCLTGDTIDYSWSTAIYTGIVVAKTIDSSDYVMTAIPDILEQWKESLKGDPFTYDDFTPEQLEGLRGPAGIIVSETEPTDDDHPVWINPDGEFSIKSAYQYATEGGYTGTEEEFTAKMASESTVYVTLTYANSKYSTDKTYDEIKTLIDAGVTVKTEFASGVKSSIYDLIGIINSASPFVAFGRVETTGYEYLEIWKSGAVSRTQGVYALSSRKINNKTLSSDITLTAADVGAIPVPESASVGQVPTVKAVDENGVPTEWEMDDSNNTKIITVTSAGAKGNGAADDTEAFRTALANYRHVYVPAGTYILSDELVIRDACKLELSIDAVLNFTQTSGNCISMKMSSYLCGNHAVIKVPYSFSGNVIYVSTALNTSVTDVPPFTKWDPQWKTGRYVTDLSISKQDSRGFHYSVDGGCSGTAVYIEANGNATSTFIWGLNFSGLRIAGAFSYGIHAKTIGSGYNHEMRLEAFIDACEIGLCLEDCNNAYASVTVQPRAALTTDGENVAYAKHGIQLIRSRNTDLSGARVWDWSSDKTLWTSDADCEYQHIAMVGNCSGTILNDFFYYEMPSYDIRSLIYTDTDSNLEKITILQEPFTRWFKPIDNKPMFYDGSANNELLLKSAFDAAFQTEMVEKFDNKLIKSTNSDGTIFNDTGYQSGAGWSTDGVTLNTGSEYAGITCTGFIPCAENAVIRLKGMSFASGSDYCRVILFDSSYTKVMHVNRANLISNASSYFINNYSETDDGCQFTITSGSAAYFKINVFTSTLSDPPAISVNEGISYIQEGYLADGIKVKVDAVEGYDTPLIGATTEFTPTQVYNAVAAGRNVVITYTSSTYGALTFTGFGNSESMNVTVANLAVRNDDTSAYLLGILTGYVSTNVWNFRTVTLTVMT